MSMQEDCWIGYAPRVLIRPGAGENPEAARYRKMWKNGDYRTVSPGEELAMYFLAQAKPPQHTECIDFGCGTGRGAYILGLFGKLRVTMVDFADNCLDPEVAGVVAKQPTRMSFVVADLAKGVPVTAPYGFCTDVMEHIPQELVPVVLQNIFRAAHHVFFAIATIPDVMGGEDGPLHLTVQPMEWWEDQIRKAGATVHWAHRQDDGFSLYCSAWEDVDALLKDKHGKLNTDESVIDQNVAANVKAGWQHAQPFDRQDREVVLLAGGPSLADHIDEIKALRSEGAALITTNGAYNWALAQGMRPSMQVVVDAREFNARFTRPVSPDCLYMMASQVHPTTLEGLPHERTFLWHTAVTYENELLIREHHRGYYFPVPGGSTVVLRAIPLLRMCGFWRIHIFGFDSCVLKPTLGHHAYMQPENDDEPLFPVVVGGRQFFCTPWMISQASEFKGLCKSLGDEIELNVVGDGLIAHIIATGADIALLHEAEESVS
jgi:hypothetical protein